MLFWHAIKSLHELAANRNFSRFDFYFLLQKLYVKLLDYWRAENIFSPSGGLMRPEAGGICHICHMVNLALGVNVFRSSSCPAHTLCVCPPPTRCLNDHEMNQKWRRASAISLNFARNTRPPTLYTSHNAMAMFTPCLHELGLIGYALSLSGAVVTGTNINCWDAVCEWCAPAVTYYFLYNLVTIFKPHASYAMLFLLNSSTSHSCC